MEGLGYGLEHVVRVAARGSRGRSALGTGVSSQGAGCVRGGQAHAGRHRIHGYCIQFTAPKHGILYPTRGDRRHTTGPPEGCQETAVPDGRRPAARPPGRHRQGSWSARTIRSPYTAATWLPAFAWNFTVTAGFPATSDAGTEYVTS